MRSFMAGRINDPVAHGKVYLRNNLYVYSTVFFFFLTLLIFCSKQIQFILHSKNRDQRMRQVVAYKRLKTME